MPNELQKMQAIVMGLHAVAAAAKFGASGPEALRDLIDAITRVYRNIDPGIRSEPIVFFRQPHPAMLLGESTEEGRVAVNVRPEHVGHELDGRCVVEALSNGSLRVFKPETFDLKELSTTSIVYVYHERTEQFLIDGQPYTVINPSPSQASVFARPTFSSLNEALENYRAYVVRDTSCFILEGIWQDPKRLCLRAKPEATMRRSLHQHLRTVFPGAEVRPEQVVDESHPVDIKVTWPETSQRAIIEIKWLGQSCNNDGAFATSYTEVRARDGARQLAGYLDADRVAGPGLRTRGYLVVFDARRRGLQEGMESISPADGLHYRDRDITFDPPYHQTRPDFAPPVRMFAEPVVG